MHTDTAFIDNARKRVLFSRGPDGNSFTAVDVIRNNFVSEEEYLIYDYCDNSHGGISFVMKSSARKAELLLQRDTDGIYCLSQFSLMFCIAFSASVNISQAYPS